MIEAECTWGDGPDVLLSFKEKIMFATDVNDEGRVTAGSFDLTAEEARALGRQLLLCAESVEDIEMAVKTFEAECRLDEGGCKLV